MAKQNSKTCSFCGRSERDGTILINGERANICIDCIELCHNMVKDSVSRGKSDFPPVMDKDIPTPKELKEYPMSRIYRMMMSRLKNQMY